MTLAEFKAWFEGFSELMEGPPSEKQWERIKARVAEIDGAHITKTVFVKRYYDTYRRWWGEPMVFGSPIVGYASSPAMAYSVNGVIDHGNGLRSQSSPGKNDLFNSTAALTDLGKAEFRSLNS